jgi:hypothetical protein
MTEDAAPSAAPEPEPEPVPAVSVPAVSVPAVPEPRDAAAAPPERDRQWQPGKNGGRLLARGTGANQYTKRREYERMISSLLDRHLDDQALEALGVPREMRRYLPERPTFQSVIALQTLVLAATCDERGLPEVNARLWPKIERREIETPEPIRIDAGLSAIPPDLRGRLRELAGEIAQRIAPGGRIAREE